jgi:hypothetical protein
MPGQVRRVNLSSIHPEPANEETLSTTKDRGAGGSDLQQHEQPPAVKVESRRRATAPSGLDFAPTASIAGIAVAKADACGIHATLVHLANEKGVGWKKKTALMLLSVLLVVAQMAALLAVTLEGSFPVCNYNDDCLAG